MSPQDSSNRGLLGRIDIYTVLLVLSFLAVVLSCALLSIELGRYKWNVKATGVAQASASQATVAVLDASSPISPWTAVRGSLPA